MGRGIVESGLFRSERYQLARRTSDPSTTQEGEMWIRTDLAPDADQLATLRFDSGGSTWDIPVYNAGASGEKVEEIWRVSIDGTTGFVPLTDDSPAFDALKYQHNGSVFGAHDALTSVPDSVIDRFEDGDVSEYSGGPLSITTSTVYEGDYSGTANSDGVSARLDNGAEGNPYTYSVYMNITGTGNPGSGFLFGAQSESSSTEGYAVIPKDSNNNIVLTEVNGNTRGKYSYTFSGLSADQFYRVECGMNSSGDIFADVFDLDGNNELSYSWTPTVEHTGGGYGVWLNGGSIVVDYIQLL